MSAKTMVPKRDHNETLQSRWHLRFDEAPDAPAIGFYSRRDELIWRTRGELYANASAYASLLAESGLRRGEVCLIVLPSGELATSTLLGTLLLGSIPLLIAPPSLLGTNSHLNETIERTAKMTRARIAVVAAGQSVELADQVRGGSTTLVHLDSDSKPSTDELAPVFPSRNDIAAMQLTSGTTGIPRICAWEQRGVTAALDGMAAAMGLGSDDVCFNWTPIYHDMGLVNNLLLALTRGMPVAMLDPLDFVRDPGLWLRGLSRTGATVTWSPNFGFAIATERVADRDIADVDLTGVRGFWNAAERIHLGTMLAFQERFAPFGVSMSALKTNFGCAENVGGATFSGPGRGAFVYEWVDRHQLYEQRVAQPAPEGADDPAAVSIVGVGRPSPGMEVQILSRTGTPLPDGRVGEIALKTPSRMIGYVGDAAATRRALVGDLLRTGDLGYTRGAEVFWVGRVKERITVRGKKFDPSDLEPVLFRIEGLRPGSFAAFGIDDPDRGTQRAVVVCEVREPSSRDHQEIAGEVRRTAFDTLGISLDDVVLVPAGTLTKTSSGKRRHRHFRSLYLSGELAKASLNDRRET